MPYRPPRTVLRTGEYDIEYDTARTMAMLGPVLVHFQPKPYSVLRQYSKVRPVPYPYRKFSEDERVSRKLLLRCRQFLICNALY